MRELSDGAIATSNTPRFDPTSCPQVPAGMLAMVVSMTHCPAASSKI